MPGKDHQQPDCTSQTSCWCSSLLARQAGLSQAKHATHALIMQGVPTGSFQQTPRTVNADLVTAVPMEQHLVICVQLEPSAKVDRWRHVGHVPLVRTRHGRLKQPHFSLCCQLFCTCDVTCMIPDRLAGNACSIQKYLRGCTTRQHKRAAVLQCGAGRSPAHHCSQSLSLFRT